MSYVSPWAVEIVGALDLMRRGREATRQNPLPPARSWPVRLLDAARITNTEDIKTHNARLQAEALER